MISVIFNIVPVIIAAINNVGIIFNSFIIITSLFYRLEVFTVFNIVGIQVLDFTDDKGNPVKGTKFHCMREKEHVDGYAVETVFVRSDVDVSQVKLGSEVEFITGFRESRVRSVLVK